MNKNEMSTAELLLEAVGIVTAVLYIGLQIYYGILYGSGMLHICLNSAVMILVYSGLTLLQVYPERVNSLTKEACSGKVRKLTVRMVRSVKLIFVISLLFTSICDIMGIELNAGYSLVVVVLIVAVTLRYEYKIIRILKQR